MATKHDELDEGNIVISIKSVISAGSWDIV